MVTQKTEEASGEGKGSSETEQFGKGDIGILNYALTLEYLATVFYEEVVKSGLFKGEELAVLKKFGAEEQQHVEALHGTVQKLGGKPAPEPKSEFPLENAKSVAELAGTVEPHWIIRASVELEECIAISTRAVAKVRALG